jgi:hypothetical protein
MIHYIYIVGIFLITIAVIVYYYMQQKNYEEEMKKIALLESLERKRNEELENARSLTTPCPYGNFDTPRSCFVDSDNKCSWNIKTKRCEIIN